MRTIQIHFILFVSLTLITGGCGEQPPSIPQTDYDTEFTLQTAVEGGRMIYMGVGGDIDGVINPDLIVTQDAIVHLVIINGDGIPHDLALPELMVATAMLAAKGDTTDLTFAVKDLGDYSYYCTVAGHRQAGMEGNLIVRET